MVTVSQVDHGGGNLLLGLPDHRVFLFDWVWNASFPVVVTREILVTSSYVAPLEAPCRMCAVGSHKVAIRYAALSHRSQSCSATMSNCHWNMAHEVDPSNLGSCAKPAPNPVLPPDPWSAQALVVKCSPAMHGRPKLRLSISFSCVWILHCAVSISIYIPLVLMSSSLLRSFLRSTIAWWRSFSESSIFTQRLQAHLLSETSNSSCVTEILTFSFIRFVMVS